EILRELVRGWVARSMTFESSPEAADLRTIRRVTRPSRTETVTSSRELVSYAATTPAYDRSAASSAIRARKDPMHSSRLIPPRGRIVFPSADGVQPDARTQSWALPRNGGST